MPIHKHGDDDEHTEPATLQVSCGRDLHDVDLAVGSLARSLSWLGPLVLLLSLAGGLVLAGRALRPIDQIARTAAAIGASDLDQRIPVHGRDELAALAAVLNRTFERLQSAFARQQRFTADAAHELRTPLAVVAGNVELALARARSPAELQELLHEVRGAARQMQALIEGLLTLARTDGGAAAGAFGSGAVDVAQLCREAVQAEAAAAVASGVDLRCNGDAGVRVRGDATCLQQLLRNLIDNAVRYNRSGGHVVVHARRADGQAVIEVEDDGIGIPAAALPRLGERFFRVDSSRTRATGGSGLGLSIAMAIAQAHGGALQVRSVEHRGTCVSVELPLAAAG
jgi:two-component system, OmpR family, sensor kinase